MDVYLSTRRELLVVKKGCPIPPVAPGGWRKSKNRVAKVSAEIKSAGQTHGYYMRKLTDRHHTQGGQRIAAVPANVLVWTASHPHGFMALSASQMRGKSDEYSRSYRHGYFEVGVPASRC